MHDTLYMKITDVVTTSVTIGPDDRGTVRTIKGDSVHERPLLFPAILTFADSDTVTIPDRAKLDRVMEQKSYRKVVL